MQPFARFKINEPQVIQDTIEGEAVIVNLASGNYYSLDKVGAEIWENLEKGNSVGEILENALAQYAGNPGDMENSIKHLIEELIKEELVVPQESDASENFRPVDNPAMRAEGRKGFEAPVLKKYSDMQDLLLLDPIHEVDEAGWPNIKANPPEKE